MTAAAELARLREELAALRASWEYAFAMGHGCSVGEHPRYRAVRRRADALTARIGELSEATQPRGAGRRSGA